MSPGSPSELPHGPDFGESGTSCSADNCSKDVSSISELSFWQEVKINPPAISAEIKKIFVFMIVIF
jgi:hypothetical protein